MHVALESQRIAYIFIRHIIAKKSIQQNFNSVLNEFGVNNILNADLWYYFQFLIAKHINLIV